MNSIDDLSKDELKERIISLQAEIDSIKEKKIHRRELTKNLAIGIGSRLWLGKKLKDSLITILKGDFSNENIADVLIAILFRFTRLGVISIFAGIIAVFPIYLLIQQNNILRSQTIRIDQQNKLLNLQTNLLEADRRSALILEAGNVMNSVSNELDDSLNLKDSLSAPLIGRIIALSQSFKPYKYLETDSSLSKSRVSPERGYLFIALFESKIDSNSLNRILRNGIFTYADLENANLQGINLNQVNLSGANLSGANLSNANLARINLTYSNLNNTDFTNANMPDADISFSNVKGANFNSAGIIALKRDSVNWDEAITKNSFIN